jgi:outer membrane protein assembly factor BamE
MRIITILMSILLSFSLTHCVSYDFARRVRQQGNLLPQEKIDRLQIGMNKEDVAILMGTSLLTPTFNPNRWDYAYTVRRGNGPLEVCKVSLFFNGNCLAHIEHIN